MSMFHGKRVPEVSAVDAESGTWRATVRASRSGCVIRLGSPPRSPWSRYRCAPCAVACPIRAPSSAGHSPHTSGSSPGRPARRARMTRVSRESAQPAFTTRVSNAKAAQKADAA